MPRAETLVKPAGSMRRTTAASSPSPPQPTMRACVPGSIATASGDRRSTATSRSCTAPIWTSSVPACTTCSLCVTPPSTTPDTGALTATQHWSSGASVAMSVGSVSRARADS